MEANMAGSETEGDGPLSDITGRRRAPGTVEKRPTEQALILLQENIYKAWRAKKVLSLVSFDVKGAYNGVYKERLLQRLKARGIPEKIVQWIDAFCSRRTATIVV